jgi:hypothetical protein
MRLVKANLARHGSYKIVPGLLFSVAMHYNVIDVSCLVLYSCLFNVLDKYFEFLRVKQNRI